LERKIAIYWWEADFNQSYSPGHSSLCYVSIRITKEYMQENH
jgi:hypothetical protein